MNKSAFIIAPIMLMIGLAGGYWLASSQQASEHLEPNVSEPKILFYRNPMNPEVTSPIPAKDGMGMDYIPVFAEQNKLKSPEILFYRNPMNPEITSAIPAKDNMGMDYVPVYAEEKNAINEPAGTVNIDLIRKVLQLNQIFPSIKRILT